MIHAGMLLASGLAMMLWRPCRSREGRAPRVAIVLLMTSVAAVWLGSLGLAVGVAAGEAGETLTACGVLWRQLLAGDLAWWRVAPLAAWAVVFPLRASAALAGRRRAAHAVFRSLTAAGEHIPGTGARDTAIRAVPGLATPAVTLGLVRPAVFVDAEFWASATVVQRDVVLAHELAHAHGRHAVAEAMTSWLVAPLSWLPGGGDVYDCVRRHLEALADDAAARRHGRQVVGTAVGRIALVSPPAAGLGVAGACVWRVQRLIEPSRRSAWRDRTILLGMLLMMLSGLVLAVADTALALGRVAGADFCPI